MLLAQGDRCRHGKGRTSIRKVDRRHHQHGVTPMLSLTPGDHRCLQKWTESADDNGVTVALTSSGGMTGAVTGNGGPQHRYWHHHRKLGGGDADRVAGNGRWRPHCPIALRPKD